MQYLCDRSEYRRNRRYVWGVSRCSWGNLTASCFDTQLGPKMNETIMVVDDDESNLYLLESLLDDEGYNVIGARNYPEMAAELRKARPALILLDYMMPGENGIEICRILKNDAELESIPIVMVSAVDDSDTIAEGIEAGAIDWVPKPVDDEAILEHVRLAVG